MCTPEILIQTGNCQRTYEHRETVLLTSSELSVYGLQEHGCMLTTCDLGWREKAKTAQEARWPVPLSWKSTVGPSDLVSQGYSLGFFQDH